VDKTLMAIVDINKDGMVQLAEITIGGDLIVLATPEIAGLPYVIAGLVAAGGLAAALSTADGLLLTIANALSHDVYYKMIDPNAPTTRRLIVSKSLLLVVALLAAYVTSLKPGDILFLVGAAFSLAASGFFPALVLGVFWKRANKTGRHPRHAVGSGYLHVLHVHDLSLLRRQCPLWFGINPISAGIFGIPVGFLGVIIGSLLTPPRARRCRNWWTTSGIPTWPPARRNGRCVAPPLGGCPGGRGGVSVFYPFRPAYAGLFVRGICHETAREPAMLTAISILKALFEVAALALLGQGVLYLLAGQAGEERRLSGHFHAITRPLLRVARLLVPRRLILDQHIGLVAFLLMALGWYFSVLEKQSLCMEGLTDPVCLPLAGEYARRCADGVTPACAVLERNALPSRPQGE
jgi:hypothetical protein